MIKHDAAEKLRRAAEARLAAELPVDSALADRLGLERLVHELQVHQVELELQNESLRQTRIELERARDRYADLYEFSPVGYLSLTVNGLIAQVNLTGSLLLGHDRSSLLRHRFSGLVVEEDQEAWTRHFLAVKLEGKRRVELMLKRADGTRLHAQIDSVRADADSDLEADADIGKTMTPSAGGAFGVRCTLIDVTARRQVEDKLKLAASVFTHAHEGIMITTAEGRIIEVNESFSRITGYSRAEVQGRNPRILASGRQDSTFYAAMWRDLLDKGNWCGEIWNRRKDGELYAEFQTISAVRDAQGVTRQYVSLFSDVTERKEHERQLEHIAHYDALTTLPNRVLLADRLHQAMAQCERRGQHLAVAYLDLDGFKAINDLHGHQTGDQLLQTVAMRMKQALRDGDTLARLGGDEFVAVLLDLSDIESAVPTLSRLLAATARPVAVGEQALQVSASVGVTFFPQDEAVDPDQLLRQADQAMYQAKLAGKNRYHVFNAEQDRSVRSHHENLETIRCALVARQFVLHYQPKVNMRTGAVIGVEALIRWQHPEKGLLPPAEFLPVIEDHPLAIELGEWVIESALDQIGIWHAAGLALPVSVNIGARQLQQAEFVARLRVLLATHSGVVQGDLELEVLETGALEDLQRASQAIHACREIGVRFALDDFGTGYSSLTYLKLLPVDLLKIDQSFVRGMLDDPEDLAILDGVIGLATAFRRQVIAEGVETVEQGELLLQLGCELAQGFCIARPMPASAIADWLAGWQPDLRWLDRQPVARTDLPVLFACVEHRAWMLSLESYLAGKPESGYPINLNGCRFGVWLDAELILPQGQRVGLPLIETQHQRLHVVAQELCELKFQGQHAEVLARIEELRILSQALLEQMQTLFKRYRNLH